MDRGSGSARDVRWPSCPSGGMFGSNLAIGLPMSDYFEFALNLTLPSDVGRELRRLPIDGFCVEAVTAPDEDKTARFGLAKQPFWLEP